MKINEIFLSIDGEVNPWGQGTPSLFYRLQGCNLKCDYCDTPKSQDISGGIEMTIQELKKEWLKIFPPRPKITITGGEPLLQEEELLQFLNELFPYQPKVSIETNGTLSLGRFRNLTKPNPNISLIVDWKLNEKRIHPLEYINLAPWDFIKFIIGDREDYECAKRDLKTIINTKARIAFSPFIESIIDPTILWEWITEDKLFNVILNIQLHKWLGLR